MENGSSKASGSVPADAPENCPGTASEAAGSAAACQGCPNQQACASAPKGPDPDVAAIEARMAAVKHKILVLSGKGGVGKSTLAAQLAFALAQRGREVGLLDIDICGPSVPRMLGLEGQEIHQSGAGWSPVYVEDNLGVMSIGFMLPNKDDAIIWRGPRKNSLIKQFLKDVDWGAMDYLIVDAPPGTSDEHISLAQYLKACGVDGAVVVTTPQEVSLLDVRKELTFCRKVGIPVLGVVENMSGLRQPLASFRFAAAGPDGGERDVTAAVLAAVQQALGTQAVLAETQVFHAEGGGAEAMAASLQLPFLGRIPLDPGLGRAAEEGRSLLGAQSADSPAGPALRRVIDRLVAACGDAPEAQQQGQQQRQGQQQQLPKQGPGAEGVAMDPLLSARLHLGF